MRLIIRGAALLAGLVVLAAPLAAQRPPRGLAEVQDGGRGGFWAGLSLGAGGEAFDLRDGLGYSDQLYRPTVSLRLGGTVGPALRLGGEALVWINENGNSVESLSSVLFVGQLYPAGNAGLYLKGGLGFVRNAFEVNGLDDGDNGFAGLLGAGYELPLGRRVFLVPSVDFVQHWYSERNSAGYRERLLNFGLGLVFQTGR
jgi:hypothetical protein